MSPGKLGALAFATATSSRTPQIPTGNGHGGRPSDGDESSNIPFTATFNTAVTGLTASVLNGDGAVTNGTVASVTGSGTNYTINVTPTATSSQTGELVTFQIPAGAAQNAAYTSDSNLASNTVSETYDTVAPVLTSTNLVAVNPATLPPGTIISPYGSFQIQLVYNEPVIATNAVLHLNAATQSGVTGSGTNTLTFTFTPSTVASTRLDFVSSGVLTGTITDAAGNAAVGLPAANGGLYNDDIMVNGFSSQTSITPLTNTVAVHVPDHVQPADRRPQWHRCWLDQRHLRHDQQHRVHARLQLVHLPGHSADWPEQGEHFDCVRECVLQRTPRGRVLVQLLLQRGGGHRWRRSAVRGRDVGTERQLQCTAHPRRHLQCQRRSGRHDRCRSSSPR